MQWIIIGALTTFVFIVTQCMVHKEPIEGWDINGDGVRDDVGSYIDAKVVNQKERKIVRKIAQAVERQILHPDTEPLEPWMHAYNCFSNFTTGPPGLYSDLEAQIANTIERQEALIKFSGRFNGQVLPEINPDEKCD